MHSPDHVVIFPSHKPVHIFQKRLKNLKSQIYKGFNLQKNGPFWPHWKNRRDLIFWPAAKKSTFGPIVSTFLRFTANLSGAFSNWHNWLNKR